MALGQLLGAALGLTQGLIGTGSTQQDVSQSSLQLRPEDLQNLLSQRNEVQGSTLDLLKQLQQSRAAISQGYQMPTSQFQFNQMPDVLTRGLAAQGAQGLAQQGASQRASLAQQFRGPVGQILGRQAEMQTRLQQNPLLFQAFQQQQGRELVQEQQRQANINAANQALLGREQALTGLAGTGVTAQQNLFDLLSSLSQLLGTKTVTGAQTGRSGGLIKV